MKKRIIGLGLMTGLSVLLAACGSSGSATAPSVNKMDSYVATESAADYAYDDYMPEAEEMAMYDADNGGNRVDTSTKENATNTNRKLIRRVNLNVETKTFDELVANVTSDINKLGGYIENMDGTYGSIYSSYRTSKSANIVARVPANKLDEFVNSVGESSNITFRSESVEDVTLTYVDMESHKKMLMEEQNRLLEFLEQAETVEDIISLEDRLTSVKYQIDSMESQLRTYDNKVDYSTVTININEVVDYTVTPEPELSPIQRMKEGFVTNVKNVVVALREFGIWFVVNIPYFILIAIVVAVLFIIIKFATKKNEAKIEKIKEERDKKQKEAVAKMAKSAPVNPDDVYVPKPEKKE